MEIYCIYITEKGKLIYKRLKWDNFIEENGHNSYRHRLILKIPRNKC